MRRTAVVRCWSTGIKEALSEAPLRTAPDGFSVSSVQRREEGTVFVDVPQKRRAPGTTPWTSPPTFHRPRFGSSHHHRRPSDEIPVDAREPVSEDVWDDATSAKYLLKALQIRLNRRPGISGNADYRENVVRIRWLVRELSRLRSSGSEVGDRCLKAALQFCAAARMVEYAEDLYADCERRGVAVTRHSLHALLDVHASAGNEDGFRSVLRRMRLRGLDPNERTHMIQMKLYSRTGNEKDAAALFGRLYGRSDPPHSMCLLMLSCCSSLDSAANVVSRMRSLGYRPNTAELHLHLRVCQRAVDARAAEKLLQDTASHPSTKHMNTVMLCHFLAGDRAAVGDVLRRMAVMKLAPDMFTFGTYISAQAIRADSESVKLAEAAFERALSEGFQHSLRVWGNMLEVYAAVGDVHAAEKLRREHWFKGLKESAVFVKHMQACYRKAGSGVRVSAWPRRDSRRATPPSSGPRVAAEDADVCAVRTVPSDSAQLRGEAGAGGRRRPSDPARQADRSDREAGQHAEAGGKKGWSGSAAALRGEAGGHAEADRSDWSREAGEWEDWSGSARRRRAPSEPARLRREAGEHAEDWSDGEAARLRREASEHEEDWSGSARRRRVPSEHARARAEADGGDWGGSARRRREPSPGEGGAGGSADPAEGARGPREEGNEAATQLGWYQAAQRRGAAGAPVRPPPRRRLREIRPAAR
eukprot:TRINITY_DN8433_c0_g1_i1.p1 TRINITY_DN8433_c0_g1~~TRINITY_DN8433_c0_g1_i1.p1  ORF type:complete len:701 (+),score=126.42 TRINITY_DN8433_c0_g1_i1:97-2199(+)